MTAVVLNEVRKGVYLDSVALMRMSRAIATRDGVQEAALMMGTPANHAILTDAGLIRSILPVCCNELITATPNLRASTT